jgi:hypothetical protein
MTLRPLGVWPSIVMVPALQECDEVIFDLIYEPVFLGDPSRPTTR